MKDDRGTQPSGGADRFALVLASYEYDDPTLRQLVAPSKDAESLGEILSDPAIGGFSVRTLLNEPAHKLAQAVEAFFQDRRPQDLLLLYFSGHGIKNVEGDLFFAARDTDHRLLRTTALPAKFVDEVMHDSRSRQQLLVLDCCHSGAFARGLVPRAGARVGMTERLSARGRIVLTASDAMQYAFEGDHVSGEGRESVFTSCLVQGLLTGEADRDRDGKVSHDELFDYINTHVRQRTTYQTPEMTAVGVQGDIIVAHNPRAFSEPAELPTELVQAIESPFADVRKGAVAELQRLAEGSHPGLALAARAALTSLADDDSRRVSTAAAAALERAGALATPSAGAAAAPAGPAKAAPTDVDAPADPAADAPAETAADAPTETAADSNAADTFPDLTAEMSTDAREDDGGAGTEEAFLPPVVASEGWGARARRAARRWLAAPPAWAWLTGAAVIVVVVLVAVWWSGRGQGDVFPLDPDDGLSTTLPVRHDWQADLSGIDDPLDAGFTGLMTNGQPYGELYDPHNVAFSSDRGLTIGAVPAGDARDGEQHYGFQFGVPPDQPFTAATRLIAPFEGIQPQPFQSLGLFVGTGDQDNYVKLVVLGSDPREGDRGSIVLAEEFEGEFHRDQTPLDVPGPQSVDLSLTVDPSTGNIDSHVAVDGRELVGARGLTTQVPADWFTGDTGVAVGIISTSVGPDQSETEAFPASWAFLEVTPAN